MKHTAVDIITKKGMETFIPFSAYIFKNQHDPDQALSSYFYSES